MNESLQLLDLYPERGMYKPGELVRMFLEYEAQTAGTYTFTLMIFRGVELLKSHSETRALDAGRSKVDFTCQTPLDAPAGYGVEIRYEDAQLETTFDVLSDWTTFPRYGFVCDFTSARSDAEETIQTLAKYHLNGLQFYDWQYRHDELVPPQDEYLDPLNRPQSLKSTKALIKAAHAHGMAAMPYLAIYAASAAFWRAHPEWMLYDADHQPIPFGEDFLGIMNPAAGSLWQQHLLAQCQNVLKHLPFDGLHIDQYGEPKTGFDEKGQPVDIPQAFSDFVTAAANQHPGRPVLFNAVGNWPIEKLAASPTTFNYIEVWPPDTAYTDLVRIVRNARSLSGEKPVVIALYLPAERTVNNLLADALINSAGGTRIELGENGRLLSDPYFPKHEAIPVELNSALRHWADCVIRYEEWFGPLISESAIEGLKVPVGVQSFFRKTKKGASLSLVNLRSETALEWNTEHAAPDALEAFEVEIALGKALKKVWLVDLQSPSLAPIALDFKVQGGKTTVTLPGLCIWSLILFES